MISSVLAVLVTSSSFYACPIPWWSFPICVSCKAIWSFSVPFRAGGSCVLPDSLVASLPPGVFVPERSDSSNSSAKCLQLPIKSQTGLKA